MKNTIFNKMLKNKMYGGRWDDEQLRIYFNSSQGNDQRLGHHTKDIDDNLHYSFQKLRDDYNDMNAFYSNTLRAKEDQYAIINQDIQGITDEIEEMEYDNESDNTNEVLNLDIDRIEDGITLLIDETNDDIELIKRSHAIKPFDNGINGELHLAVDRVKRDENNKPVRGDMTDDMSMLKLIGDGLLSDYEFFKNTLEQELEIIVALQQRRDILFNEREQRAIIGDGEDPNNMVFEN